MCPADFRRKHCVFHLPKKNKKVLSSMQIGFDSEITLLRRERVEATMLSVSQNRGREGLGWSYIGVLPIELHPKACASPVTNQVLGLGLRLKAHLLRTNTYI